MSDKKKIIAKWGILQYSEKYIWTKTVTIKEKNNSKVRYSTIQIYMDKDCQCQRKNHFKVSYSIIQRNKSTDKDCHCQRKKNSDSKVRYSIIQGNNSMDKDCQCQREKTFQNEVFNHTKK